MAKAMRFVAGAMLSLTLALPAMAEDVTADTVVAVSYTHLDVYKRQVR